MAAAIQMSRMSCVAQCEDSLSLAKRESWRLTTRQQLVQANRQRKIGVEVQKAVELLRPWAELPLAGFPHWPWVNPNPWSWKLWELGAQDGIVVLIFLSRLELDEQGSLRENCVASYEQDGQTLVTNILASLLNTSLTSAMVLAACVAFAIGEMIRTDSDEISVFGDCVFLIHYSFTLITFMLSVGGVFAGSVTYSALCTQLPDIDSRVRHLRKNRRRIAFSTYTIPILQLLFLVLAVVFGAWTISTPTGIIATATLPISIVFAIIYLAHTPYLILRDQHTIAREIFEIMHEKPSKDPMTKLGQAAKRAGKKASVALADVVGGKSKGGSSPSGSNGSSGRSLRLLHFPWSRSRNRSGDRSDTNASPRTATGSPGRGPATPGGAPKSDQPSRFPTDNVSGHSGTSDDSSSYKQREGVARIPQAGGMQRVAIAATDIEVLSATSAAIAPQPEFESSESGVATAP